MLLVLHTHMADKILEQCETSAEVWVVSATVGWERAFLPSATGARAPYSVCVSVLRRRGLHPVLFPIT